jgi:hypothetical protein
MDKKFEAVEGNGKIFSLAFPNDREDYILKLFVLSALAAFLIWVIYKSKDDNVYLIVIYSFFAILLLMIIYEKIVFFLKIDKITASDSFLHLSFKNLPPQKYSLGKIGIKISFDINGTKEVSFYDLSKNKKIFSCKENEVDKNDLQALLLHLHKVTGLGDDIIKKGTYGEVIPLVANFNDMSHTDSMSRYYDKYYFYELSGYGWLIYPFVVIVVLATLYFVN